MVRSWTNIGADSGHTKGTAMRLVAFLQLFNENETGNLVRCLDNCKVWADEIFIYDDCSTDGSQDIYKMYTDDSHIIYGTKREFDAELFHKQQLLNLVLKTDPQWIGWIDGDTTLCKHLTRNVKEYLLELQEKGFDGCFLHNLNLWRHPAFYRLDSSFNGLWHVVFWKNNKVLRYEPTKRLHGQQYPIGMQTIFQASPQYPLLHYGFSSELQIVKKYLTYKSYGQSGDNLDRLINEKTLSLVKVDKAFYPDDPPQDYDLAETPKPITYDKYKKYNTWEEFKSTDLYTELLNG